MSSNFGTWSPNELVLPNVESDLDYKFFFVKESGSIDGLNINFKEGDWLVYIKENGTGNWFKTGGGAVSIALPSSQNMPDPGFYTKVRLDNFAQIIDAGYLSSDDLPKHSHDLNDINGDWKSKIQEYVVNMFQNQTNGSVKFKYDPNTQTISADVDIDDETIIRNEWGELEAVNTGSGTGSSLPSFTGKIQIENVKDLSNRLSAIDAEIKKNFIVCKSDSALSTKRDLNGGGTYLSVKFDGTSLVLNSDGELSVSPSVLLGGATDGSDMSCGSHTHTVSQITELEKEIVRIIEKNKTVDITQIPIDGETVIINSAGQLACIGAGTKPHKHTMDDISDLNKNIANVWASDQPLQDGYDYNSGKLEIAGQSIGYSVKVINDYLKDVDERLSIVENKVSILDIPVPNGIEFANFDVICINEINVLDKDTLQDVKACESLLITSDYFYPANKGTLRVVLDNNTVFSINVDGQSGAYSNNNFKILGVRDSYFDNAMYRGKYDSMRLEYKVNNIDEGYHTLHFEHELNNETKVSSEITFQTYSSSTPAIDHSGLITPVNNTYISGIPGYNGDGHITFTPKVLNAFSRCFMNKTIFQYSIDNGTNWITPNIIGTTDNKVHIESIDIYSDSKSSGSVKILERYFNVKGDIFENQITTPSVLWNDTDVESFRVIHGRDFDDQEPEVIGAQVFQKYDPKTKVPMHEMCITNNIGRLVSQNYTNYGGADYSDMTTDIHGFVWCNFKFPAPYMNNLHISLLRGNGLPFDMNKDGTLSGIKIFVAQSDTDTSPTWVNGNIPYPGYGKVEGLNGKGLDLFKSDKSTRFITFGQSPIINSGYLYVKVGTKTDIDLGALVSSIKESIYEWS